MHAVARANRFLVADPFPRLLGETAIHNAWGICVMISAIQALMKSHARPRFQSTVAPSVLLSVLLLPLCGCFSKTVGGPVDAAVQDESPINVAAGSAECDPGYQLVPGGDYLIGSDPSDSYTRLEESPQWTAQVADPTAPPSRVDRGGGWQANIDGARSSLRARYEPSFTGNSLGFRCARPTR